ncbi:calcineurin-like phosphoesterase superfamily domain protein [Clostridium tepidiprofundi DSM 19306]|uniref:Calcineurin-like phosphoesterase superfamily domain protein n=1 Tax=Clostridium tepidiprofundi DSM 19306 TaxID=1121338 RepID=A0A151B2D0_9CLOT|nr:metallophosphoesterase [Clostridium tepidiprofundi]KYH34036.1 calcineurin-like phosphoesterase superfamily domain protein [Clostridium tepidiprofundi DSM 19306]
MGKILLVSDKEDKYIWDYFDKERFKDIDFIISCGDLKASYLEFLVTMLNVPLFYVHGNHDGNYEQKPPQGCICIDNKLTKYKGIRILGFGGCNEYRGGAFQYTQKDMKKQVSKMKRKIWLNKGFDILVTHAPAKGLGDGEDLCHIGFEAYNELLDKYAPKYFFHGHQHLNYNREKRIIQYKSTTIVNAYKYYIINTPGVQKLPYITD